MRDRAAARPPYAGEPHVVMLAPFGIRPKGTLLARMLPLGRELVRTGYRVSIVAPPVHNPQDGGRRDDYDGVTVIHTAFPQGLAGTRDLQFAQALLTTSLALNPDLIHLFKPKGYGGLAALGLRAMRPRLPLVVDSDDWEGWGGWNDLLPYPLPARHLFAWQERDLPRRAAAVTVASRTLESLVWSMGVPAQRVFYVPNGIDAAQAGTPRPAALRDDATMLLYTRFWEFDVRDLVAALAAIIHRCPAARLLVVGKGERGEERRLLELAQRAGVAASIDYRGWVEPAQVPALLNQATLALVPLDDTLINRARCSAKLLELMAAGLPIVAGNVGQTGAYLQHGTSGLLVAPGDPAALAQAALRLLADSALRSRLAEGAQRVAATYSWERLAPRVMVAYQLARGILANGGE